LTGNPDFLENGVKSCRAETGETTDDDTIDEQFPGGIPIESATNLFGKG
jgi:hypothetical protein